MSSSFLHGFQGGLGTVMQLYDFKDRRQRAKRDSEWQDKVRAQQEKQWAHENSNRSRQNAEQRLRDYVLIEDTLGSWMNGDPSKMPPGFYDATNRVYGDVLNKGYGKNKSLDRIVPTPDGKNWMAKLNVEDEETGDKYSAPLTVNRTNDKNDQVRLFSPDDIANWYAEAKRSTAHLPAEERKAMLAKVREDVYMLAGDSSIRNARVKREEADRLYRRDRSDASADRAADHANAKEIQGMKNAAALNRERIKIGGNGALKPSDMNTTYDDLTRMIFRDYEDAQGNFMGASDLDIDERSLRYSTATAWEQAYPGMVDYATTARITKVALADIPFTVEQAREMAGPAWDREYGGGEVATLEDGSLIEKEDFVKGYIENAPKLAEQVYMAKFQNLMRAELARRSKPVDLASRRSATPKANQTDAEWIAQQRQAQSSRQPIPAYAPGEKEIADRKIKAEKAAKSILDSIETPKSAAEIDLALSHGMKALRAGAPTQGVVDALRAQGIREDLIRGLVDGTTGQQYQ